MTTARMPMKSSSFQPSPNMMGRLRCATPTRRRSGRWYPEERRRGQGNHIGPLCLPLLQRPVKRSLELHMRVPQATAVLVSVDGTHHPDGRFPISCDDLGLSRGHGVFETLPVYDSHPSSLDAHLQRLEQSCVLMGIPAPMPAVLRTRIRGLLEASSCSHGVLRIQVTQEGRQILAVRPLGRRLDTLRARRLAWPTPPFPPARAKHTSRAGYTLAPAAHDVDEVIRTTPTGHALEGTWSSVFCFRGGTLYTCPDDGRILPGITRGHVLFLADQMTISVKEEAPGPPEPNDSWFLTSSLQGIVGIHRLDDTDQPPMPEPIRALRIALDQHTGRPTAPSA
ncbi:MAG: hypothetical protein CL927_04440 [Deltaproteobacteria bacterium]|nr:hypothetical protein [Deltaproteobacteria bacterium]